MRLDRLESGVEFTFYILLIGAAAKANSCVILNLVQTFDTDP